MPRQNLVTDWSSVPVIVDLIYASRIIGVTPSYLRGLCRKKEFPGFKIGNQWRIYKEDLQDFKGSRESEKKQLIY